MKHYIYKTTNLINGKIYIGKRSHENPEKDKYLGSGNVLKQAISKYGKQNFKKEILEIFLTEEQAYQKQSQLVTMQFIQRNDTYNICPGGEEEESLSNALIFANEYVTEGKAQHSHRLFEQLQRVKGLVHLTR